MGEVGTRLKTQTDKRKGREKNTNNSTVHNIKTSDVTQDMAPIQRVTKRVESRIIL